MRIAPGIVGRQDWVFHIPDSSSLEAAAPLLCARITCYHPLAEFTRRWAICSATASRRASRSTSSGSRKQMSPTVGLSPALAYQAKLADVAAPRNVIGDARGPWGVTRFLRR